MFSCILILYEYLLCWQVILMHLEHQMIGIEYVATVDLEKPSLQNSSLQNCNSKVKLFCLCYFQQGIFFQ